MNSKILLKDIPAGKFHSAIFTTYSINLYYLEQQVLPILGSKGIHYVSLLVDGNMLSNQLETYCLLSETKKRNYSLHGVQCDGAFHPKLILLAGDTTLLLLIGSGNLTSSGHGKNLESWNAVYIDDAQDHKLGLIIQAWNFIKDLHTGLGISAQNKLTTIEDNCALLKDINQATIASSYPNNTVNSTVSFLATSNDISLFNQLLLITGENEINTINIMSPYYDIKGHFIHLLNDTFKPRRINIILQEEFGIAPVKMKQLPNVHFYLWSDIQIKPLKQKYFHAKNIILEGTSDNYMFSGSANASIPAFGNNSFKGTNQEAGLLYMQKGFDYLAHLGVEYKTEIQLQDIEIPESYQGEVSVQQHLVFIKTIEKNDDQLKIYVFAKVPVPDAEIRVYSVKAGIVIQEPINIPAGESLHTITVIKQLPLLYAEIFLPASKISNKQFIIDINAFEATNPSPQNRSLNQIRKLVENGSFSSQKIIDYLNTIYQQKVYNQPLPSQSQKGEEQIQDKWYNENKHLIHLSYEEIQKRIRHINSTTNGKGYIEYKSVRLWDSIFSYLKEAKETRENLSIDEEETEDIGKSTGRLVEEKQKNKKSISKSNFDRLKDKVQGFLLSYTKILESKINNNKADQPNLIDLTMFLIVLEILLHLVSHREKIDDQEEEKYLLTLTFSDTDYSWSDFVIHAVGLFTLWSSQKRGVKLTGNDEYQLKATSYMNMAFKTSVSALSIFSLINKTYDQSKIDKWKILGLKNAGICFNPDENSFTIPDEFIFFIPEETKLQIGEEVLNDELNRNIAIVINDLDEHKWYDHPEDGITFIERKIPNDVDVKFLKLIHPGYIWSDDNKDYWSGGLFTLSDWRWRKARSD